MISYRFKEPRIVEDKSQPSGVILWWISVNGYILAYCDTEAEAIAVRDALIKVTEIQL